MGVETNRIETEFILKALINKNIEVEIHVNKQNIKSKIIDFNFNKNITIKTSISLKKYLSKTDKVSIYFNYFKQTMNFTVFMLEISDNIVIFSYPKNIYKNLSRKYERIIPPKGSKVMFSIKGEKFQIDFPKTDEYNEVKFSELKQEERIIDDIVRLINNFKSKILESISFVEIVTYRNKKPETFEEKLIYSSGKMLYISSTANSELGTEIVNDIPMINYNIIENNIDDGIKKLKTRCFEKNSKGIYSEMYCPILYCEYIVGYIQLQNKKEVIDSTILEYVYQFSKIISYALKKNGYFGEKVVIDENYEFTIVDISGSGLLFRSDNKKFEKSFFLYTNVKIELYIGMKKIPILSRLMRKYKSGETSFFGLTFIDIPSKDFESFFYLIYGREITENDITKWEGGAFPPRLDLG